MKEISVFGFVFILILFLFGWSITFLTEKSCYARWEGSYKVQWHLFSGCRVLVDGVWWPEDRVRTFED